MRLLPPSFSTRRLRRSKPQPSPEISSVSRPRLAQLYADLVYDGRWYTAMRENLDAFVDSVMRYTSGDVRVKFFKGSSTVTGRRSPYSLYDFELATYSTEDEFDHAAAVGFIDIYSLPARTQMKRQTMHDAR